MAQASLRAATLLSSVLYETYEYIVHYLGERLGLETSLHATGDLGKFARGEAQLGFLCGLLYVHLSRDSSCPVELLAAPVLEGERYQDAPIYFSDVIVRRESPYQTFADLRGCTWAYNERASHSGYNLVCYSLLQRGLTLDYFRQTQETGAHLQSLHAVLHEQADATALDSHLLDALLLQQPALHEQLRVIDMFGPSPIPPLVIARDMPSELKQRIRATLLSMHRDPQAARELHKGCIKCFAEVHDADYDAIRRMYEQVQESSMRV